MSFLCLNKEQSCESALLMPPSKRTSVLFMAVVLTLLLRLLYGFVVFEHIAEYYSWRQDDEYSDIATTLIRSGKYAFSETSAPTMRRLPAYPLALAGIFAVLGKSPVALRIFQCFLCAITCIVIYYTAREVTTVRVAEMASFMFALYPNSILYSARALPETTYFLFLSIFCFTLVKHFKSRSIWITIASGLSFGLLVLTKSTTVLLPFFLLMLLFSSHYRKRARLVTGRIILIGALGALVLLPWVIRNFQLTGKIIFLSTKGGESLYQGFYFASNLSDGRSGLQIDRDALQEVINYEQKHYVAKGLAVDEYYEDKLAYSLAWAKMSVSPKYTLQIFLRNAFLVWFLNYGRMTTIVSFFVHMPILLLSSYGFLLMLRTNQLTWLKTLPLFLIFAYFNIIHAIWYPHVRFMSPVIGTIAIILSAYSISSLISKFKQGH
jgi:4-amino-4-deoxy-L-arabinose transferase-like glycosyltransferase